MSTHTRNGFRWTVNEILSLQREFELLGWTIDQIAEKHKRTPNAIIYKLDQEGFSDYNELYSNYIKNEWLKNDSEDDDCSQDDDDISEYDNDEEEYVEDEDDIANLSERVYSLEESVTEIKDMIKQMMTTFSKSSAPMDFW